MSGNSNGTFFALFSRYAKPKHVLYMVRQWCIPPETCRSWFPLDFQKNIPNLNVFPVNIQSILQETSHKRFTVVSLVGFLVGHQLYIIDGSNGRPERVHYWRWRSVKSRYSVTHKAGGKTLISGGHQTGSWPKFICSVNDSAELIHLPVKWHLSSCKL